MESGQAGTQSRARSNNSAGLRFDTRDDALNFARQFAQDGLRRYIKGGLSIAEAYVQNYVQFHVEVSAVAQANKFNVILRRDPFRSIEVNRPAHSERVKILDSEMVSRPNANKALVFIRTYERKSGVESWIPSLADIQILNESENFGVDVSTPSLNFKFEVIDGFPYWEVDALRVLPACQKRSIADSLIERVSKVIQDAVGGKSDGARNLAFEAQATDFFTGFVVDFVDKFVVARIAESEAKRFKINNFCVCLADQ